MATISSASSDGIRGRSFRARWVDRSTPYSIAAVHIRSVAGLAVEGIGADGRDLPRVTEACLEQSRGYRAAAYVAEADHDKTAFFSGAAQDSTGS